jgi:hypothetical protein
MTGIVEIWAKQIGWQVREGNVIVEGYSDVALLTHARYLFLTDRKVDVFGGDLAIMAAGRGDDGGVDGVNRRLQAARQIAEADLGPDGAFKYRFIGLFDNDEAGRRGMRSARDFDRRIIPYQDVFLLHPNMPPGRRSTGPVVEERAKVLNAHVKLDWEIEDLLSPSLLDEFSKTHRDAVVRRTTSNGICHTDFTRQGKAALSRFVRDEATVADVIGLIRLICALRDYLHLQLDHITL